MQRHEVRIRQQLGQVDHGDAVLVGDLGRQQRVGGEHVHAEGLRLAGDLAADAPEADDAHLLAAQPHDAHAQALAAPRDALSRVVEQHDAPVPRQQQREDVVRHLVDAVVGHVGDDDAELGGSRDVYVVDADAVASDDDAPLGGAHDLLGHLLEAGQDAVDVTRQRDERLLAAVGGDDELGADLGEHGALRLDARPDVVGNQHFFRHVRGLLWLCGDVRAPFDTARPERRANSG